MSEYEKEMGGIVQHRHIARSCRPLRVLFISGWAFICSNIVLSLLPILR